MTDKRMLILPADVVEKINANRGDLSQGEFIGYLIDSRLDPESNKEQFVSMEELREFEQGIKELLRNFMDFFVSYGLELGHNSNNDDGDGLNARLQGLNASLGKDSNAR